MWSNRRPAPSPQDTEEERRALHERNRDDAIRLGREHALAREKVAAAERMRRRTFP